MSAPRLTEERLRFHLDSNQVMRERMCLALMPLLGPYTRECPRRPKGGPDGGRDIEAIFQGTTVVWGAVGFRNGGGNDDNARRDAEAKFRDDLERAVAENPSLQGFVFFTNVDLTPAIVDRLKEEARGRGIAQIDIFDIERLRHALDSPEGLIARLQYLELPMSATEQIALVSKFGNELQNAVTARFDRVERTLSEMERFLAFERPLHRLDIFLLLNQDCCSADIGDEAFLVDFEGLQGLGKHIFCLCINQSGHPSSPQSLVTQTHIWLEQTKNQITKFAPSLGGAPNMLAAYCELSLSTGGHPVRLADLTRVAITVKFTSGLYSMANRLIVDANGYELFDCPIAVAIDEGPVDIPDAILSPVRHETWQIGISDTVRHFMFDPPVLSGRLFPLRKVPFIA